MIDLNAALSPAVLERILGYLRSPRDLAAAEATCIDWHDVVHSAALWRRWAPTCGPRAVPPRSCKAAFVDAAAAARWRSGRARSAATLQGHTTAVSAVCTDAAGDTLVTASRDGAARVWELTLNNALHGAAAGGLGGAAGGGGREVQLLQHAAPVVAAAAVGPGGLTVTATAAAAHLWRGGTRVRSFPVQSTDGPISHIALAGTSLLAVGPRALYVFDLYSASLLYLIRPGTENPDLNVNSTGSTGNIVVGGGTDRTGGGYDKTTRISTLSSSKSGSTTTPSAAAFAALAAAGVGGGGAARVSSLLAVARDPDGAQWAALVGAAGGLVSAHCTDTGRCIGQLHSRCAAAVVALQARPPWQHGRGGNSGSSSSSSGLVFGLDAASQLHVWAAPDGLNLTTADVEEHGLLSDADRNPRRHANSNKAAAANSASAAQAPQLRRAGASALLASCRLGSHGLGVPTSLVLPARGSSCLFAAGWGGVVCVVSVEESSPAGGAHPSSSSDGVGGSRGSDLGQQRLSLSVVRTLNLSRLSRPRALLASPPPPQPATAGNGGSAVAESKGARRDGGTNASPATAVTTNVGVARAAGVHAHGDVPGAAVLSMCMLSGGRLVVGQADGTVRVLRFADAGPWA